MLDNQKKHKSSSRSMCYSHRFLERIFICAEVIKYTDFVELGNENAVKA
jgi:hypothetical protein